MDATLKIARTVIGDDELCRMARGIARKAWRGRRVPC